MCLLLLHVILLSFSHLPSIPRNRNASFASSPLPASFADEGPRVFNGKTTTCKTKRLRQSRRTDGEKSDREDGRKEQAGYAMRGEGGDELYWCSLKRSCCQATSSREYCAARRTSAGGWGDGNEEWGGKKTYRHERPLVRDHLARLLLELFGRVGADCVATRNDVSWRGRTSPMGKREEKSRKEEERETHWGGRRRARSCCWRFEDR